MEEAKEIRIEIPADMKLSESEKEKIESATENAIMDVMKRDAQAAKIKTKTKIKIKEKA
jgi:hypothetical protein